MIMKHRSIHRNINIRSWLKGVTPILLLSIIPLMQGCIAIGAAGAGAAAYAYFKGDVTSHLDISVTNALPVVRGAMEQFGYVKVKERSDPTSAIFVYKDALDIEIVVKLESKDENLSEIGIRVGKLGSESRSLEILKVINSRVQ